eukprot:18389-Pelagococcus_subviridis.AAC.3
MEEGASSAFAAKLALPRPVPRPVPPRYSFKSSSSPIPTARAIAIANDPIASLPREPRHRGRDLRLQTLQRPDGGVDGFPPVGRVHGAQVNLRPVVRGDDERAPLAAFRCSSHRDDGRLPPVRRARAAAVAVAAAAAAVAAGAKPDALHGGGERAFRRVGAGAGAVVVRAFAVVRGAERRAVRGVQHLALARAAERRGRLRDGHSRHLRRRDRGAAAASVDGSTRHRE